MTKHPQEQCYNPSTGGARVHAAVCGARALRRLEAGAVRSAEVMGTGARHVPRQRGWTDAHTLELRHSPVGWGSLNSLELSVYPPGRTKAQNKRHVELNKVIFNSLLALFS